MTEIRDPNCGKRFLVDVDRKTVFTDRDGTLLSCAGFVERAVNGGDLLVVPISRTSYAGFGATERIPKVQDFVDELEDLAGVPYREQLSRLVGQSLLIKGIRYFGDYAGITLPGLPDRVAAHLARAAPGTVSEREELMLRAVQQHPEAEF